MLSLQHQNLCVVSNFILFPENEVIGERQSAFAFFRSLMVLAVTASFISLETRSDSAFPLPGLLEADNVCGPSYRAGLWRTMKRGPELRGQYPREEDVPGNSDY